VVFWQLTIDANDPPLLTRFWSQALGYRATPPAEAETTWHAHYRARLGDREAFDDRLFDPTGAGPALWFQQVPEAKAGKNRLHLDVYTTARDDTLTWERRVALIEAKVDELVALGASVVRRTEGRDPGDEYCFVVMADPEGNEFCVA
jgi:hypothetical protein